MPSPKGVNLARQTGALVWIVRSGVSIRRVFCDVSLGIPAPPPEDSFGGSMDQILMDLSEGDAVSLCMLRGKERS